MRFNLLSALGLTTFIAAAGCAGQDSSNNDGAGGTLLTGAGGGTSSTDGAGGTTPSTSSDPGPVCVAGEKQACGCTDDLGATIESTQTCLQDSSAWGECDCSCGDNFCEEAANENCHTCKADCGTCAPCEYNKCKDNIQPPPLGQLQAFPPLNQTLVAMPPSAILADLRAQVERGDLSMRILAAALAPAKSGELPFITGLRDLLASRPASEAMMRRQLGRAGLVNPSLFAARFPEIIPPLHTLADLPNGGTTECGAPMFRVRIGQIKIHNPDEDDGDEIYCMVKAESAAGSEVQLTPVFTELKEDVVRDLPIAESTFWGQAGPKSPQGNLRITYQCIEQDDNSNYQALANALGAMAGGVATIPGMPYGWAFGLASVVLPAAGQLAALDKDDVIFNAAQDLEPQQQLELTQGRWWSIRKDGKNGGFGYKWDWELRIHSWGCAQYGILNP